MGLYMIQAAYTSEAWAAQVANPQNVLDRVKAAVEALDGRIIDAWYCFGEYDIIGIAEYPDATSAAGYAIAAAASGGLKSAKTTPLLSIAEGLEAMKKAGATGYQPPK
jgi:uncharacterized protein with GYD domain